jgi:hypothetical protein
MLFSSFSGWKVECMAIEKLVWLSVLQLQYLGIYTQTTCQIKGIFFSLVLQINYSPIKKY